MQLHASMAAPGSAPLAPSRLGILTISGYGLSIAVERGHLTVRDGIGRERRCGRLHRAATKLTRLVVLGHTGVVTLEALHWLHAVGAAFVQIDRDGALLHASAATGRNLPQLRRAQAMAPWTGAGGAVARDLLMAKLRGQARVVGDTAPQTAAAIEQLADELRADASPEQLRVVESQAASAYWQALATVPALFARRDAEKVPDHWRAFGSRASLLTGSPRLATTPVHALLNYLYALLEAEARVACLAVGLDPGLGVLHADLRSRDSLACDLMEAVRPQVDEWLLRFLERRPLAARDFFETNTGQCRVLPPLTHELAESLPLWGRALAPVAEQVADKLMATAVPFPAHGAVPALRGTPAIPRAAPSKRQATPLTQTNRSAGRPSNRGVARPKAAPSAPTVRGCRQCGAPLPSRRAAVCSDACRAIYAREVEIPRLASAGPQALARLRAAGRDPTHGGQVGKKRGATNRQHIFRAAEWTREHGRDHDPAYFRENILPGLQSVSLLKMARAVSLSVRYCSLIRRGERIPHPSHWEALARAAAAHNTGDAES